MRRADECGRTQCDDLLPLVSGTAGPGAKRFIGMGFTMLRLEVTEIGREWGSFVELYCEFKCLCGRSERFMHLAMEQNVRDGYVNAYELLHQSGATSREHLLIDGYTAEQVDAMEERAGRVPLAHGEQATVIARQGGRAAPPEPQVRIHQGIPD